MPSTSETGHAKNVANFQDLISFCTGYGAAYNPSNTRLSLAQLTALYTLAQQKLADVKTEKTAFDNATNERVIIFDGLKQLATRITNAFAASGTTDEAVKDVQTINRKIQGARAEKLPEPDPANPGAPLPASHSVSQQSYDNLLDSFSSLITTLSGNPLYTPNEADLQMAALQTKQTSMQTATTAVTNTYTDYSNAIISRDEKLYDEETGLVATAGDVKKYVKSIFSASSPEYAQVSGLQFKTP